MVLLSSILKRTYFFARESQSLYFSSDHLHQALNIKHLSEVGVKAQQLRTSIALAEDPGLIPSDHIVAHSYV